MSSSSSANRTIYIGGLAPHITEAHLVSYFSTYGDILDVQLPRPGPRRGQQEQVDSGAASGGGGGGGGGEQAPHRGFGFVDFSTAREAEDAIDNMHLNEIEGRVISVNLAKPSRKEAASGGNMRNRAVWQDEEWIKQYGTEQEGAAPEAAAGEPQTTDADA
ncbi:RNA-binding domain-containing protein [Acaromyces ingoldii]|uniref:RNA-binding domain-containing protein n=1 Tax=Acaromyces ingoldii TaxID=215250 RepID=A0A316YIB2_9BASI|nr:RNA-binding domain-containing protein [Acaromyces ingoldii]PWN89167.1 RNA-binding domain-containing protein [Acaromyces ingoldii]